MGNNQCPICKRPFKTAQGLKVHIKRTHDRKEKKAKETNKTKIPKRRKAKPEE